MHKLAVKLDVSSPCLLIASGDAKRLEVLRSPIVREGKAMYEPVRRFIEDHGMALTSRETFADDGWMFGQVEVEIYAPIRAAA